MAAHSEWGQRSEMKYTFPSADPVRDRFVQLQMGGGEASEVRMEVFAADVL